MEIDLIALRKTRNISEIREAINSLEKIDLRVADYGFLKKEIKSIMGAYIFPTISIENNIFRGRLWLEERLPPNISELSYRREKEQIIEYQRANPPKTPMFYGSAAPEPIFYELGAKVNEIILVSSWKIIAPFWVNNVGIRQYIRVEEKRKKLAQLTDKIDIEIYNFFSQCMAKAIKEEDKHEYKLTSAIAESLIHGEIMETSLNGLIYPSVAHTFPAHNIALTPQAADHFLKLDNVIAYRVAGNEGKNYELLTINGAKSYRAGKLLWENKDPEWSLSKGTNCPIKIINGKLIQGQFNFLSSK